MAQMAALDALARSMQHVWRQVDAGDLEAMLVVGQRKAGADADFKHLAVIFVDERGRLFEACFDNLAEGSVIDRRPTPVGTHDIVIVNLSERAGMALHFSLLLPFVQLCDPGQGFWQAPISSHKPLRLGSE